MEFTAQQIADFLGGEVHGDASVKVSNFSKIEDGKPGTLSFLSNPKYNQYIYESQASIVLVNADFVAESSISATLIRVKDAYGSLAKLMTLVDQTKSRKTGISSLAFISDSAKVGENCFVAPFVYIGENVEIGDNSSIFSNCNIEDGAKIGNDTKLFSGVTVYHGCVVGNNCTLHAGSVIGSDGFGFAPNANGSYDKIPQMGNVVLEDDVEIGANTIVDRATLGSTIIRKGVKIDNLVQIAHNVEVGENTVIAAQTGISGSTKLGKRCILAGQVGVAGHLQIADGTIFGAQTGVPNSVKIPNQTLQGYPAMPIMTFHKSAIVHKNLPELQKLIYSMQKKIEELEKKIN